MTTELEHLLTAAHHAVDHGEQHLRGHRPATVHGKGDRDMTTDTDLAIERGIRALLARETPAIPVHGEEEGGTTAVTHWELDPVDGTANHLRELPLTGKPHALWTAAQQGTPTTVVVLDNRGYGALRSMAETAGAQGVPGLDIGGIDFVALARSMGCHACDVTTADELHGALADALTAAVPTLVHVAVAPGHQPLYDPLPPTTDLHGLAKRTSDRAPRPPATGTARSGVVPETQSEDHLPSDPRKLFMPTRISTVRGREHGDGLRAALAAAGLLPRDAAAVVDWHESKLSALVNGKRGSTETKPAPLLDLCRTPPDERDHLESHWAVPVGFVVVIALGVGHATRLKATNRSNYARLGRGFDASFTTEERTGGSR